MRYFGNKKLKSAYHVVSVRSLKLTNPGAATVIISKRVTKPRFDVRTILHRDFQNERVEVFSGLIWKMNKFRK